MRARLSGDQISLYTPFHTRRAPRNARGHLEFRDSIPRKDTDELLQRYGQKRFSRKEADDFNWEIWTSFESYGWQRRYDQNTPTKAVLHRANHFLASLRRGVLEFPVEAKGPFHFHIFFGSDISEAKLSPEGFDARLLEVKKGMLDLCCWLTKATQYYEDPAYDPGPRESLLWLIGFRLPEIYSDTFNQKFGVSDDGPGIRFVADALRLAKRYSLIDRTAKHSTIKGYRRRVVRLVKAAGEQYLSEQKRPAELIWDSVHRSRSTV